MEQLTRLQDCTRKQELFCKSQGLPCAPIDWDSKVGFAIDSVGLAPINGLRHPPSEGTSGWYIWCGENLSQSSEFFAPLHTIHLFDRCPEALDFLGLPPGYRFLIAGDYFDVWFDESLLNVQTEETQ